MTIDNILNESTQQVKNQLKVSKRLVNKWSQTGLLNGLSDSEKNSMAILLENQAHELIKEANQTGTNANSEQWSGIALPLVRRIFADIAAKEFVSVQPMSLPSGLVFYMDFKYGTAKTGFQTTHTSNNPINGAYQQDSVFGQTNNTDIPEGGLYGSGRFGYSINNFTATSSAITATAVVVKKTAEVSGSLVPGNEALFNFDSNFVNANNGKTVYTVAVPTASMVAPDLTAIKSFGITEGTNITTTYPAFTTLDMANGAINFVVTATAAPTPANVVVAYSKQPTASARGDFEDGNANGTQGSDLHIPELDLDFKSVPIVAKTRKLKAVWTPEIAQDLNAYHSIDAEQEITSTMSEYISEEIDMEILEMLMTSAATTEKWSAKLGYEYDSTNNIFRDNTAMALGTAWTQQNWFQTLGTKIQKVSNKIHQKTMRGGANFIVCSPDVATILESIAGYSADTDGNKPTFAMGVSQIGTLKNRFTVYKNPYLQQNRMLLGFKGSQFLECGAVYAPYIPLIQTPLIYDPTNFTPRKGMLTRYAKQLVRPEYFGIIDIYGLDSI